MGTIMNDIFVIFSCAALQLPAQAGAGISCSVP